ncbi:O-methyltransferase [Mycolicibacterium sediminis]|uniref:O-methyltransferase n=1 Tax=Mycolicibacterium sediminis TaxID=1286180 RepID=A0A7I7QQJ3_9MYCO|nr:class I SAM-dependent methyltransferase [Mycolicibacterium sediminis]BBY28659.1 O-methyltransferase [Mycolicibacterium sediminis]
MTDDIPQRTLPALPRAVTPTTILAAELTDACAELEAWGGAPHGVLDRMRRARDLAGGLDPYVERCTTGESPALARLAQRTRETDWAKASSGTLEQEMLSGHVEGRVLDFLIRMSGARRVLEVGMFTGYSALAMAEALPDGGTVVACEVDRGVADFARTCFDDSPAGDRITIEVGPATDTLRRLAADGADPFDFVFVDADKAGYLGYLDQLLDGPLLSDGAVIAVDNTLMQGQPYTGVGVTTNGAAIASFNDAVAADARVEQVMLPLRDGLTLIRRVVA